MASQQEQNHDLIMWQGFVARLARLREAAAGLNRPATFDTTVADSSDDRVTTVSVHGPADPGTHTLTIHQLAQAQKLITASFPAGASGLGLAGHLLVNGCVIRIAADDSLNDIAVKFTRAGAHVRAQIVHLGPSDFRLILTANKSGVAGIIALTDIDDGCVLRNLGLIAPDGAKAIRRRLRQFRDGIGHSGCASLPIPSPTCPIAAGLRLPAGSPVAGTVSILGQPIAIDLAVDSIKDIDGKIRAVGIAGLETNIVAPVQHGDGYELHLLVADAAEAADPAIVDDGNVLAVLGLVQQAHGSAQLLTSRDARFTLDDVEHAFPENTIPDLIPGVTLTLVAATTSEQIATATLTVHRNPASAVAAVAEFVDAFNDAARSEFASSSDSSEIVATIAQAITTGTGSVHMSQAGLSFTPEGVLDLDSALLEQALAGNDMQAPNEMYRVFGLSVACDNPDVAFVGASAKTKESPADGYAVSITQPATCSRAIAAVAQCGRSQADERLIFTGPLFPVSVKLTLPAGNTIEDSVTQINRSARLRGRVTAAVDVESGKLVLNSRYGASGVFNVVSDQDASQMNSGIGKSAEITTGCDVAGTIAGEPATGEGRTLTGCVGNENTEALQILVSVEKLGNCGDIIVTRGIADRVYHAVNQVLEPGQTGGGRSDLNAQIDDTEQEIARMNDQLGAFGDYLAQTLSAMDVRVHHLMRQVENFKDRSSRTHVSRQF
jgi:flagellar hook-associated protein 2